MPATQEIISKLLEGLQIEDGRPVLLVDCLPNRFLDLFSILVAISNQPLHLLFSLEILFFCWYLFTIIYIPVVICL